MPPAAMPRYASVSPLLVPVNKLFDYEIPEEMEGAVRPGSIVVAPFGPRRIFGLTVKVAGAASVEKVKPLAGLVSELKPLGPDLLDLVLWISHHYLCPFYKALEAALPFGGRMSRLGIDARAFERLKQKTLMVRCVRLAPEWEEAVRKSGKRLGEAQLRLLERLKARPEGESASEAIEGADASSATLHSLEKRGVAVVEFRPIGLDPVGADREREARYELTPTQEEAFSRIERALDEKKHEVFLLRGVTGSGKTEVYLHAAARVIERGRRALVLVPEIALATQIIERFARRFPGRVAVWHSSLTFAERLHQWEQIAAGGADVVIGARSAVFAPLDDLGVVVLDEEQEAAYKQESMPRYNAREAALRRAAHLGAPVVMGSATPSIETNYRARRGRYVFLNLESRVAETPMPEVAVADMRKEKGKHLTSALSPRILDALRETLEKGEQSLVYLNLRGYSTFVQCWRCGAALKCPRCAVSLRFHKRENALECHWCDFSERPPERCPECESSNLRRMGMGTEKVFDQIRRAFKEARVERMDRDTVRKRGEYQRIVGACERGEVDILVGTQMIAKGLDFSNVTLVAVVSADIILNMPDFRAAERTFQILTQVAGRAGRREKPGRVIVQSWNPAHPAIECARLHDYDRFYEYELPQRRAAGFPPFRRIVKFIVAHEDPMRVRDLAQRLESRLKEALPEAPGRGGMELLGPGEAPINKIAGRHRWFIALRGPRARPLVAAARAALKTLTPEETEWVSVDVDPQSMF